MSDGEVTALPDVSAPTGLTPIEEYSPAMYVFFVAGILFALETVPELLHIRSGAGGFLVLLATLGTYLLIWWTAVRRRQFSVGWIALQLTIAADLAAIVSVLATLATMEEAAGHFQWRDVISGSVTTAFAMSPLRFIIAAIAVAVGRSLSSRVRS